METLMQYRLILVLLLALTPITGEPTYREGLFRKITSKCLTDQNKTNEYASSPQECSIRCITLDECDYFSYCNGQCYMHRSVYDEVKKSYGCSCSSYILIPGKIIADKGTNWQKVFEMTVNSFTTNPIYLYWDILPIEKVKFWLMSKTDQDYIFVFDGRGTNSTSWFHSNKLIENAIKVSGTQIFTMNENFRDPYFSIKNITPQYTSHLEAKRISGSGGKYKICVDGHNCFDALIITVLFK